MIEHKFTERKFAAVRKLQNTEWKHGRQETAEYRKAARRAGDCRIQNGNTEDRKLRYTKWKYGGQNGNSTKFGSISKTGNFIRCGEI